VKTGNGSFWLDSTRGLAKQRPRLEGDLHCDIAVVGAGYTGLWTAYWLTQMDPSLRVAVLEQEYVGFGASGRNGGWISGKTVGVRRNLLSSSVDHGDLLAMERECHRAVGEIVDLMAAEGKEIDAHRGGWMQVARSESERERLRRHVEADREWGLTPDEVVLLGAEEAAERFRSPGVTGAMFSPFAASCNPAKLVYALAELCEDAGVEILENTRVESIRDGDCRTSRGHVHARNVVVAVEGYTPALPGLKRSILPMISSMVVTQPLTPAQWEEIGWNGYECVSGAQHVYFYSQRTSDGRIALGGRGRPYFWNSRTDDNGELDSATAEQLMQTLRGLFPSVPMAFEHAWRGVLGVPRDWSPFIDVDHNRRTVRAGGYAGQGVTAAFVAGRATAGLLAGGPAEQPNPAWIRKAPRNWEPEPLRWIGTRAVQTLYSLADDAERRRGGPATSLFGAVADKVAGR
jgi:glycine/D-amino acid oxidase-like deaminating enzyme